MEIKTVKKHIDKRILEDLPVLGYDGIRQYLFDNVKRHEKSLINTTAVRSKYLSMYISAAMCRIYDLYRIENDKKSNDIQKNFKILLFKEKIENEKV